MDYFISDVIQALVKKEDVSEILRSHLETAVNTLLQTELTAFLDYDKYDRVDFNSGNSRNGVYHRTLHTEYGDLELKIPRDRNGDFKQHTGTPDQRSNDILESFVIHMLQKGVTTSETSELIERMYGHHYTPQTISNMTQVAEANVEAFHGCTLSKRYICVYLDATFLPVKREAVSKEAAYIAVGIREDGSKEVLAYTVAPTESAYAWKELTEDIRARGTEEVLLFISDGLTSMKDSIHAVFPKIKSQTCFVHVSRNIAHKVRVSDRKAICEDLKTPYRADDKTAA